MQFNAEVIEHASGNAVPLAHKPQQYMFRTYVIMVEALRLLLGKLQHLAGAFSKFVESICHLCFSIRMVGQP